MLSLDEIIFDEEPHTYTYRGKKYISVTQAIREAGLGDDFSHVPQDRLEYAQRRGRMVHLACHYFDEGDLDISTVAEEIRGYVDAYIQFRVDRPLKVICSERRMISVGLRLATTPDLIALMAGQRVIIERKTSQRMSKAMGLQTAGQKMVWNLDHPTEPARERYGLRLEKNGKYKLFPHEDYEDELAFREALEYAHAKQRMERWTSKYGPR